MRLENTFLGVDGVGETIERTLWSEGITHWDEFHAGVSGVGETRADRIESFIARGRHRLDAGDAAFFSSVLPDGERWRLYENFRDDAAFLDIETTGLDRHRHDVTVVSLHRAGDTRTFVRGRDLTRDRLVRELAGSDLLVTFNGARFDIPFLERSFDLTVETPHVDAMYPARRVGLDGGLKSIEADLGIDRDRPDLDGRDAVHLWHRYERRGDTDALATLRQYNRDDTRNLARLMDRVTDRLHAVVFERAVRG